MFDRQRDPSTPSWYIVGVVVVGTDVFVELRVVGQAATVVITRKSVRRMSNFQNKMIRKVSRAGNFNSLYV